MPATPVPALASPEPEVYPAPCTLHDDRLRELETEQADHSAQLRAGAGMFASVQENIRSLTNHVSETMGRLEGKVDTLCNTVADIRVEQGSQKVQLAGLTKEREREEAKSEERRRTFREIALRYGGPPILVIMAGIAGAHGKSWLAAIFKAMAGGG